MKKLLFHAYAIPLIHICRPHTLAIWAYEIGIEVHFAYSNYALLKTGTRNFLFITYPLHSIKASLFYIA
jgi:hypothetical protein